VRIGEISQPPAGEEAARRPKLVTRAEVEAPLAPWDERAVRARAAHVVSPEKRREFFGEALPENAKSVAKRTMAAQINATLHDISDGRMVMGIGRGDSARRYIGQQPVRVAEFERRCHMIRDFMNGHEVDWNDKQLQLKWVRPELPQIPMYVAGYGPKALAVAGRVGDGVIIQLADPQIIQWIMDTARKAAEEAGRDPSELKCIVSAPSHISDDVADAREQVRWFPAMVSNHVMDLIERYGTDGSVVPQELTDFVQARKFYDYDEHSRVGAKHGAFVTDEICDRFCVLGNAEQAVEKLRELESIGVDQFNIYLMTHGQEDDLAIYGSSIIPAFSAAAGTG